MAGAPTPALPGSSGHPSPSARPLGSFQVRQPLPVARHLLPRPKPSALRTGGWLLAQALATPVPRGPKSQGAPPRLRPLHDPFWSHSHTHIMAVAPQDLPPRPGPATPVSLRRPRHTPRACERQDPSARPEALLSDPPSPPSPPHMSGPPCPFCKPSCWAEPLVWLFFFFCKILPIHVPFPCFCIVCFIVLLPCWHVGLSASQGPPSASTQ